MSELRKLGERGDASAQNDLGLALDLGIRGETKNPEEVVQWYQKSAAQGYTEAYFNLAISNIKSLYSSFPHVHIPSR